MMRKRVLIEGRGLLKMAYLLSLTLLVGVMATQADPGFETPIVVAAGNAVDPLSGKTLHSAKSVSVNLIAASASSAKFIRMTVHNLQRMPNDTSMAYLQIINNTGISDWINLSNHNSAVTVSNKVKAYGGIGGGFRTITMTIDVENLKKMGGGFMTLASENTFKFWINKKAYEEGASAYRVTWMAVSNAGYTNLLLGGGSVPQYAPGEASDNGDYIASNTSYHITEGERLWKTKQLIGSPGGESIRAKCMDCHTATGYDLKYFGYTNESIYKRSRFHGINDTQAKQITRYIRSLPGVAAYGRPWNPPYQPGKGLSAKPVVRWAAGAGLWNNVLEEDEDMVESVFPDSNNDGKVNQSEIDKVFRLNQINSGAPYLGIDLKDIPIHLQLPDWNSWLPRVHPVDIWPDFKNVTSGGADPYKAYSDVVGKSEPRYWELGNLYYKTVTFSGEGVKKSYSPSRPGEVKPTAPRANVFRDASDGSNVNARLNQTKLKAGTSNHYKAKMFDEYAKRALTHWVGVKSFELFHVGGLEDKVKDIIGNDPHLKVGERGWASHGASVFNNAPHKTARNTMYWEGRNNTYDPEDFATLDEDDQRPVVGAYTSVVWYYLEAILNSGHKMELGITHPVDWIYNYTHYALLADHSGQEQAMMYVTTLMKNWQVRNIRNGNPTDSTREGWALRTCNPFLAYSVLSGASDVVAALEDYSPNFYRFFLNRSLEQWMAVVTSEKFPYRYHKTNSTLNKLGDWPTDASEGRPWSKLPLKSYVPSEWDGGWSQFAQRNSADNFWRLLPLLDQVGVDRSLLADFKDWCEAAWPGPAGNLNDWDSRLTNFGYFTTHVRKNMTYRFKNMEFSSKYLAKDLANSDVETSNSANIGATRWRARPAAGQWLNLTEYINGAPNDFDYKLYAQPGSNSVRLAPNTTIGNRVMWRGLSLGDGKLRLQSKAGEMNFLEIAPNGNTVRYGWFGQSNRPEWKLVFPW